MVDKNYFLHMWKIGKKILDADQKLIIGKTFEEIADILNISKEDMSEHINFMEIGKFAREVSEKQIYNQLPPDKQELFLKFLMSKSIFDGKMPETFFRYRPIDDFLFDSLETGTFWFSKFDALNDPLEGTDVRDYEALSDEDKKEHLRLLEETYGELPPGTSYNMSFEKYKEMLKSVTKKVRDQIMILSLTGSANNDLMWKNYSGEHSGICIEVNPFEDILFFWTTHKVNYVPKLPSIQDSPKTMRSKANSEYFMALACTKILKWKYEQEWRIVKLFNDEGKNKQQFRKSMIKSIIFGNRISTEIKEKIKSIVSSENGYENVRFLQTEKIEGTSELKFIEEV
jgi:hypothetical protein